ncbi:MAG: S-layer homology domain-containing protein [Tepidanaerobacteraceae bacterium]|jgi:hypothetical protein
MKKRLALILVLTFVFSSVVPVLALTNTVISQEKAVEKVKNIFDTTSYDRFNINYNENDGKRKVWELNWSNTKSPYGSLSASIDADTGDILHIYMYKGYDPDRKTLPIPKYNEEEARKIAENFAKKLQPSEFAKTRLIDREEPVYPLERTSYRDSYYFNFTRIENDIPVEGNGINMRVGAHTGEIENYSFSWSWEPLPPAGNLISMEDAEKVFSDEVGLRLVYQRYFDYRTRDENIKLVYTLDGPRGVLIDAVTGKLLEDEYYDVYGRGAAEESMKMSDSGFTPVEIKEVEVTKNCISKEAAIDIVKKYISIPDGYKQRSANLYEDYDNPDQKIWNIDWQKTDDDEGGSIYAQVHAINSELLSFNFYDYGRYSKEFKQKYGRAAAQKKAEEFLKKFQLNRFENVQLEEEREQVTSPEKIREHYFNYTRLVNDIPYTANGFNLTVDAQNGEITGYRMRWHDREFPNADEVLTKDDVDARFIKNVGLELVYASIYNSKEQTSNYKLVYKIKPSKSYTFDAFDFKPLDYSGKPVEEEIKTIFTDIKGHWAENDIQLLVNLGVIRSAEDKFRPDEDITEGDFVKLLMIAKNHRISDDTPIPIIKLESQDSQSNEDIQKYIDAALKLGWIKPGEAEVKRFLSREKATAFVVRAMGFEKVASLSDIYKDTVKDVASIKPEYKGHVAIAIGLKLLSSADDGNFKPKNSVNRAQAATILVRMLKNDSN